MAIRIVQNASISLWNSNTKSKDVNPMENHNNEMRKRAPTREKFYLCAL